MDKVIEIMLTNMSKNELATALRSMGAMYPVGTLEVMNAAMNEGHPSDECVAEAREHMVNRKLVAAVRCIRDNTGWSLRDAKDYAENSL